MCRNIRILFNFDPPASDDEIRASALQYVRKVSGVREPSQQNREAFDAAVDQVSDVTRRLLDSLVTRAAPRTREEERRRAKARWQQRVKRMRPAQG